MEINWNNLDYDSTIVDNNTGVEYEVRYMIREFVSVRNLESGKEKSISWIDLKNEFSFYNRDENFEKNLELYKDFI
tara:strand:+ start:52 stop:279 length:228 start_codon:yes stop_codon:yes gene_type:complete